MSDTKDKDNAENIKPSRIKRAARFMFDIPSWIGASVWTGVFSWIASLISELIGSVIRASKSHHSEHVETFEAAMQRLNITEADLQKQKTFYLKCSWLFFALTLLAIGYEVYLLSHGFFLVKLVGLIVVLICLLQAVRFSFWYFQIKQQRLGCTLKEWFNWLIRGQA